MNGSILSAVMLARAVRGCLRGIPADAIATDGIVAPYAHAVRFIDVEDSGEDGRIVRAHDVQEWIRQVVAAGATDAWVRHGHQESPMAPDRVLAAFANSGGLWSVVVSGPQGTDAWIIQTRLDVAGDPDPRPWWQRWLPGGPPRVHRPWEVRFIRAPIQPEGISAPVPELARCTMRLRLALDKNHEFAAHWRMKSWAQFFAAARVALDDDAAAGPDLPDFARPDVFGSTANRLLTAAAMSWFFGGMGTWNDIGMADDHEQERQDALASELYEASVEAIEQATWPVAGHA